MIKAILIDDELHCLDTLSILLKEYCPEVQIIERCHSGREGLLAIKKIDPDLVFLDIEMPGMNGFEMLEELSGVSFAIIFTTSYDQYAIRAIRFSALDYLLKPIDPNELINAVSKVITQRHLPMAEQFQMLLKQIRNKDHQFNKIALPTAEGFELVPADQVVRCEADDNYTHLYLKNKTKITACRTLKEVEEQLHDFTFFIRVHHSHVVNLNEVTKYIRGEGGYLVMSDSSSVNVSRSRKEALLKLF
ncbi:DNA-binding response regulator [Niastella koreensis]|uniref:Two component transcriptional regulator, LytTR family n=2 Tax=Niastella koreensis TaxID=354356 RepID=G8TFG3_NIAKG|nr:LytTR family DNA-binding domain-containing protein [Niastella koreensis]AEV98394.1 two component transcriptional regulator, LytTR family [Niastella koreensis GR20-10]OQP53154.1 DNA-binding response regulator [Niastella koreensis]